MYTLQSENKFDYTVGYENVDTGIRCQQIRGLFEGGDILNKLGDVGESFLRQVVVNCDGYCFVGFGVRSHKRYR